MTSFKNRDIIKQHVCAAQTLVDFTVVAKTCQIPMTSGKKDRNGSNFLNQKKWLFPLSLATTSTANPLTFALEILALPRGR